MQCAGRILVIIRGHGALYFASVPIYIITSTYLYHLPHLYCTLDIGLSAKLKGIVTFRHLEKFYFCNEFLGFVLAGRSQEVQNRFWYLIKILLLHFTTSSFSYSMFRLDSSVAFLSSDKTNLFVESFVWIHFSWFHFFVVWVNGFFDEIFFLEVF